MSEKPAKRIEYQKFLRNKLEEESTCKLFGVAENISLTGEDDIVLQREFRIDFLFEKIDDNFPIEGVFWYFKKYNLAEFKSVNDPLNLILLDKYLGQLFWWLCGKKQAAREEKISDITHQDVTLTIITVTTPRNVIAFLENVKESIQFVKLDNGHYRWNVMAIEVHLLVINELRVTRENYAWLSFAEGRKYTEYQEKLAEDIAQDYEVCQVYFELLIQLEEEGKERMARNFMQEYFLKMPLEVRMQIIREGIAQDSEMYQDYLELLTQLEENGKERMAHEAMLKYFSKMPDEVLRKTLAELPPEKLQKIQEIVLKLSPKQN